MGVTRRGLLGLGVGMAVSGCSMLGLGEDEPEAEAGGADTPAPAGPAREPVDTVERLEIGRTATGIAVAAYGVAPGLGYARPVLVPRREGRTNAEGFLDFDFLATPPDPDRNLGEGPIPARRLRADRLLPERVLQGVRGIRVFGLENGVRLVF